MREIRLFAPAALLGAGCFLLFGVQLQHSRRLDQPLRTMPLRLAGYDGVERPVSVEEQRVAGMSDYVFRIFHRDSTIAFTLYVGYYESQTTGRTIHSPKNCLPGGGWEPLESGVDSLSLGGRTAVVNRYILANGPSRALVYYWYQGRGRVAHSEYGVKWDLLRDAMRYGRTEEALVRIMVPIFPGQDGLSNAERTAQKVAAELVPSVDAKLPAWRSGAPTT